jgi:signal transduction histidine kinase
MIRFFEGISASIGVALMRKQAEEMREKLVAREQVALAEAEAASKLDRLKSVFLQTMSHELRTPMNAILGFSDLIKTKTYGELNEKQEEYINHISNSAKHLLGIINDILDLVKFESGEKLPLSIELFPAPEAIDESIGFLREKAVQKNIILKKDIDPELDIISADKIRFKQIILNLIDNAIKFSKPQGGTITIAGRKAGDMAQFSVSDTGIGIKEENLGKLFSLFYQEDSGLSRKYGGTGIGLAIIKQLVEQHGGRLWVKSEHGEGTTFTFTVPLKG